MPASEASYVLRPSIEVNDSRFRGLDAQQQDRAGYDIPGPILVQPEKPVEYWRPRTEESLRKVGSKVMTPAELQFMRQNGYEWGSL